MGDWFKMEDREYDRKFASQDEIQAREEFEFFKPSLRNRLEYIVETGRKWEWKEEVEDINFYLEVMEDPLMMRTHGVTGIRSFVTEIHNIVNKNPIPNDWKPRNSGQGETLSENKYSQKSSAYVFADWDEDKKREFEKWKNSSETQPWGEQQNLFQPLSSTSTSTGRNSAREESTRYKPMSNNYERSHNLSSDPIEEVDFSHLYERRPRTELTDCLNSRSEPRRDLSRERNASECAFSNTLRQDTDMRSNSYQRTGNEWNTRIGSETRQQVGSGREQPFSRLPPVIQQPGPLQMTYNNAHSLPNYPPHPPRFFVPTFVPVPVPVHMPFYKPPVSNSHIPPLNQDNPFLQRDFPRDCSNHDQFSHSVNIRNQEYPPRQDNPHRVPHHPERVSHHPEGVPHHPERFPQQSQRLPQHSERVPQQSHRVPHHPERVPHHPERVPHHPERVPHHPERVPHHPERVPHHPERVPHHSHRVPQQSHRVPQHSHRVPQQSHHAPTVVNERTTRLAIPQPTATLINSSDDLLKLKEIARMKAKKCFENRQKYWENSKGRNSTFSKTAARVEHPSTSKRTEYESRKRSGETPNEMAIQEKRKKDYPVQDLEESSNQVQADPPTSTGILASSSFNTEPDLEVYGEFEYGTTKINEKPKEIKVEKVVTTAVEENEVNAATKTSAAAILTLLKSRKRSETISNEVGIPEKHKKTEKAKGNAMEMDGIPEVEKEAENQNENSIAASASISIVPEIVIKSEFSENTNEVQIDTQHSQNVIAEEHQQVVEPTSEQEIVTEEYHDSNENQYDSTENQQDSTKIQQDSTEIQQDSIENQHDSTEIQQDSTENRQDSTENQQDSIEIQQDSTENLQDSIENQHDSIEIQQDSTEIQHDSTEIQQDSTENQQDSSANLPDIVENQEESQGITNEIYNNRVMSNNETQMNEHFETTRQELLQQQHEVVNSSDSSPDGRSLPFVSNSTSTANSSQGESSASSTKQPTGKRGRPKGKKATKQTSASNSNSPQASSSSNPGEEKRYSLRNTAKRKQYQNKEAATEPRVMCRLNVIEMDKVCDTESRKKLWKESMKKFASKTLENGHLFIGRNDIHTRAGLTKIKVEADYIPPPPAMVKIEPDSVVSPEENDDEYSD